MIQDPNLTHESLFPIYLGNAKSPNKFTAGFINLEGKIVVGPVFEDARPFSEGLAPVRLNGRWGAINAKGQVVIECIYENLGLKFSEGRIIFSAGNRTGVLARGGSIVVPPKYSSVSDFSEGTAFVSDGNHYGYINLRGEEVIPPRSCPSPNRPKVGLYQPQGDIRHRGKIRFRTAISRRGGPRSSGRAVGTIRIHK